MIKKVLLVVLTAAVILCTVAIDACAIGVSAASAVLMNADTGEVIFEKDAYTKRSMASTTKIMTALLALEQCTPNLVVTVSKEMVAVEGTSMGLKAGYMVTLESLVYGMLLESGNDAANAVALALAGSAEDFAEVMNSRASEIGMKNTHFVTPSGLDAEEHYTTAYDMALLGSCAIANPEFLNVCSDESERVSFIQPDTSVMLSNHNRLLYSYDGIIGIKTGFTKKSGRCLVSAARRNGVTLVAVTLNAGDDWNDHMRMYNYGFNETKTIPLKVNESLSLTVAGGQKSNVSVSLSSASLYGYTGSLSEEITYQVLMKPFEYAPIEKETIVGEVRFYCGDKLIHTTELLTDESVREKLGVDPVKEKEKSFFGRMFDGIFGKRKQ